MPGLLALLLIAAGLVILRVLLDRPPEGATIGPSGGDVSGVDARGGGGLTLAWPAAEVARFRWTAAACAALVGAALSVSGVLLQALLRNPLASPFVLGLSSGAGLGVTVAMYIGYATGFTMLQTGSSMAPALVGALVVLGVVYGLGRRGGWVDPLSMVLIGVVVSAICGALTMMFQQLAPAGLHAEMARWMFGRIPQALPSATMTLLAAVTAVGVLLAAMLGRAMDAATFGDDEARSIGLDVGRVRLAMFTLAGALAAAAVAVAGPIAFVGIIGPHAARLIIGPRHRTLVIGGAACGAIVLLAAEIASQALPIGPGRMPVGVFTALLGGPAFIWLLRSGRGQA